MPTVRPQPTAEPVTPSMGADREQRERRERWKAEILLLVLPTASLHRCPRSNDAPHNDGATTNFPLSPTGYSEHPTGRTGKVPVAHPAEVAHHTTGKQGWTKRTTKVRLQVVPKPDTTRKEDIPSFCDKATNPTIPTVQETEGRVETPSPTSTVTDRAAFCGSGKFEIGQSDYRYCAYPYHDDERCGCHARE